MGCIKLRVVPNSKRNEVVGAYGDAIKVKIAAPAVDGKANSALLAFLAGKLDVSLRTLTLTIGEKGRDKTVTVEGVDEEELRKRLAP